MTSTSNFYSSIVISLFEISDIANYNWLPVNSSHGHLVTSKHCTKLWVGAQNSVMGMQILRVTINVQNLGAPDL